MLSFRWSPCIITGLVILALFSVCRAAPTPMVEGNEQCARAEQDFEAAVAEAIKLLDAGNEQRKSDAVAAHAQLTQASQQLECAYQVALKAQLHEQAGLAIFKWAQAKASLQEWQEAFRLYTETYRDYRDTKYVKDFEKELNSSIGKIATKWLAQVEASAFDKRDAESIKSKALPAHPVKQFELWKKGMRVLRSPIDSSQSPLIVPSDDLTFDVRASGYEDTQINRSMFLAPQPLRDPQLQIPSPSLYHIDILLMPLPLHKKWWFWTLVGTGVSVAAVGVGIALRPRDPVFSVE